MTKTIETLVPLLRDLKLKHMADTVAAELPALSPAEQATVLRYLSRWAETEKAERQATLIQSRIRNAQFKRIQTIDTFDFAYNKATKAIERPYQTLHQNVAKDCLPSAIFAGNAGLGKTHLARALGYAACQKGISTLFTTAAQMVNHLAHAQKSFVLESELQKYRRPMVLICNELGYVQMDAQASNLFFQVISARHDAGSGTIATTNLPFGKWNQIFANDAIAHAIVDRLVSAAEVFYLLEGISYREHQRQLKMRTQKN
jgi:DNA replication protein DnaC